MPRALLAIRRSPIVAAILSFALPGAGQAWSGHVGRGVIFLAPFVVLALAAGGVLASQGMARTIGLMLQPEVLLGFVGVNVAIAVWRVFATLDAFRLADRQWPDTGGRRTRVLSAAVVAVLLVAITATHASLGWAGLRTYDTVTAVFDEPSPTPIPTAFPSLAGPSATPRPAWSAPPTPVPTPEPIWSTDGRLDVLLMGVDQGPGRWSLRPDALILLSVDVATGRAALFGIPRYLQNVPLPPHSVNAFECGCFPGYINALYRHAEDNPVWFSGADGVRGLQATEDAVGALVDLDLDGRIVINFRGFIRLVNALGGLSINVPYALYDPRYPNPDGSGNIEMSWSPGSQWMDGFRALAFARTRHQDSDFDRMWRQQLVLVALRRQMEPCRIIPRIGELLEIAGTSLSTNLPVQQLPDLLELAARVRAADIAKYEFWPPEIPRGLGVDALAKIRAMVREPFAAPIEPVPGASSIPAPTGAPTPPPPTPAPVC